MSPVKLLVGVASLALVTLDVSPALAQARRAPRHPDRSASRPIHRPIVRGHYIRPHRYYRPFGFYRYGFAPFYASRYALGLGFGYGYSPFFGYGYPFYDPFWYGYPYPASFGYAPDHGGIRLQVKPKEATVYLDGYYVGIVDDFDSSHQRLAMEAGPRRIEIRAPGYETLSVEVKAIHGETLRYRGILHPSRP